MKAIEPYFHAVLFTVLYKMVITLKFNIRNFCVHPLKRKHIITYHSTLFKQRTANFPYKNNIKLRNERYYASTTI